MLHMSKSTSKGINAFVQVALSVAYLCSATKITQFASVRHLAFNRYETKCLKITGCKKGGRDCVYPEVLTSNKPAIGGSSKVAQASTRESPDSSSDEYEEEAGSERPLLETIPDGDENFGATQNIGTRSKAITQQIGKSTTRQSSETPSLVQDKGSSPTPSTEGSVGYQSLQTVGSARIQMQSTSYSNTSDNLRTDWSHLPPDLQLYLTYFYENLTYLHYSMKLDSGNFLKTLFLDAALRNEALLYAVVGFSAFQRTLHNPEGKIQDFLQYYNKAVSLLLKSLRKGERHNEGTILAILQLATIEVSARSLDIVLS